MYLLITISCLALFTSLFIYFKDPRTLLLGLSFLTFLVTAGISFLIITIRYIHTNGQTFWSALLLIIIFIFAVLLALSPTILIIVFIFNGLRLLKREGRSLKNFMLLALGILLFLYPIIGNTYLDTFSDQPLMLYFYYLGTLIIFYLFIITIVYTISSFLNLFHWKNQKLDYVVVLGSGLIGDKVPPLLASRIEKGIHIYKSNQNCKLIFSGGQGPDELLSEGQAMALYAKEQGIAAEDIIIENKARNTRENILFSKELMTNGSRFAIISNYYHLFRALLLAKELEISCIGFGAKTRLYFTLNAYIRELVGYLYLKRKLHITLLSILVILLTILITILYLLKQPL